MARDSVLKSGALERICAVLDQDEIKLSLVHLLSAMLLGTFLIFAEVDINPNIYKSEEPSRLSSKSWLKTTMIILANFCIDNDRRLDSGYHRVLS